MNYKRKSPLDYKDIAENLRNPAWYDLENGTDLLDDGSVAITDLLARAENAESQVKMFDMANKALKNKIEAVEDRAEKAEKQRDEYFKHLQGRCFCCGHKSDGFDCHTKCYGHKKGSAWEYAGPEKEE